VYGGLVQSLAPRYKGRVEVKVYTAGKDFDYLPKYGNVTKSMLVINESKAITQLNKTVVREAFEEAVKSV
jgi:hypothetical protein